MFRRSHILSALAIALSGAATVAQAHQIWIEQPAGQQAVVRFGEFGENLREVSPGLLDKFGKPTGTLIKAKGEEQPVDAVKGADGFRLPFKAGKGESIVAEDATYPLYTSKGDKPVTGWYHPAARYVTSFAGVAPRLTLDLVPTGKKGEFQVVFRGKPLPKAKVQLAVQSGWSKEAHSDEQGFVQFDLPWRGTYVAEASYTDRTPGERAGEKYDVVNYVTSLTVENGSGAAPLPAGPAATPNK